MCKKLVTCRYIGFNPAGELCCVDSKYAYYIDTKKKVEKGDFICIAEHYRGNEDRSFMSTVRVMEVLCNPDEHEDEAERMLGESKHDARTKIFVGKADLKDYFLELDKKRKREELQKKIERRFKEAEKEAQYRKLAETDPEMKALLEELEALK